MKNKRILYCALALMWLQDLHARPSELMPGDPLVYNTIFGDGRTAATIPLDQIGMIAHRPVAYSSATEAIVNITYEKQPSRQAKPQTRPSSTAIAKVEITHAGAVKPVINPGPVRRIGEPKIAHNDTWPHSVALGKPYHGWLYNPVQLKNDEQVHVRRHKNFATSETVAAIKAAVNEVHVTFANTPRLPIGNLSRKSGGHFPPHKSHQNGRDADIAYYLKVGHHPKHLKVATANTLDVPRTWVFLESMIKRGDIEVAFIDYRLQAPLYRYAVEVRGWTPSQMKTIMSYPHGRGERNALIRHLKGHHDHMHVRFHAPNSIAAVDELIARYGNKILQPVPVYTRIRRGDSLWKIGKRHRVSISKLRQWNGRKKTGILRVGRKLIIGWRRPSISEIKGES